MNAGKCSMKSVSLTILPWVPIQLAKKPLEKLLEKSLEKLEISYTGKTPKMGSLDMSQNQIWISSGFSSGFFANEARKSNLRERNLSLYVNGNILVEVTPPRCRR